MVLVEPLAILTKTLKDVFDMKSSILEKHTLTQWLSPSYPIGAYNFSQGLEYAVKESLVSDEKTLKDWLRENLEAGYFRNDAIFVKLAFFSETEEQLEKLVELMNAFSTSKSRLDEQILQGKAFFKVTPNSTDAPYPIALGMAAKNYDLKIEEVIPLFLQSCLSNVISVAQRLLPIGQTEAVKILRDLFPKIEEVSQLVLISSEADILSSCYLTDSCSIFQETIDGKIFKS
tara:strand:- start:305 stop:997 length:693 start_codon:yes stop_codon:yes gene_type:complete